MKFYFCESCGKRVTELDIESGQASDKALNGVYCKGCAAGVKTQNVLEEAMGRDKPPSQKSPTASARFKKSSSSQNIRTKGLSEKGTPRFGSSRPGSKRMEGLQYKSPDESKVLSKNLQIAVSAGSLVLVLIVIALLGFGSKTNTRSTSTATVSRTTPHDQKLILPPGDSRRPSQQSTNPFATSNTRTPNAGATPSRPLTPEEKARKLFDALEAFEGIDKTDYGKQLAAVDVFLAHHGDSIVATRAMRLKRTLLEKQEQGGLQPESRNTVPANPNPTLSKSPSTPEVDKSHENKRLSASQTTQTGKPGVVEPTSFDPFITKKNEKPNRPLRDAPKPDLLFEARMLYLAERAKILKHLHDMQPEQALETITACLEKPAFAPLQKELTLDKEVVGWHQKAQQAFSEGVKNLSQIDTFDLGKMNGIPLVVGKKAPFKIVEQKGNVLYLEKKGLTLPFDLRDLDIRTRLNLVALGLGKNAEGLVAKATSEITALPEIAAENAMRKAGVILKQAQQAGAQQERIEHLRSLLHFKQSSLLENQAACALAKFEKHFAAQEWPEADAVGKRLLDSFSETKAVQRVSDIRDRIAQAVHRGAPIRDYALTFQEGQPIPELKIESYKGTSDTCVYGWKGHENKIRNKSEEIRISGHFRGLLHFRLFEHEGGQLPDDLQIKEAQLVLHKIKHYPVYIPQDAISEPWEGSSVTWNSAKTGKRWSVPGVPIIKDVGKGVFRPKYEKGNVPLTFDVTDFLRKALKGKTYYGWRLYGLGSPNREKGSKSSSFPNLASSRHETSEIRPKLMLKIRCARLSGDSK